jgi:hypothetical protein
MPVDIVAYIDRDGRQQRLIGTIVQQSEVLHFSALPEGVTFYLDGRNKPMVYFRDQRRRLPADHVVVRAFLWTVLQRGKRRSPTKEELESYYLRCLATSLENAATGAEAEEAALWREPVVMAAEHVLYRWFYEPGPQGREELRYIRILSELRKELAAVCKAREWDHSDWPKGNHFRAYLEERSDLLREVNIRLGFERVSQQRKTVLEYIDRSQIPPWRPEVTRQQ